MVGHLAGLCVGRCLYHAVNYAKNPELYEKVDLASNAMLVGEGSIPLFQAASALRGKLVGTGYLKDITSRLADCRSPVLRAMPKRKTSRPWHL